MEILKKLTAITVVAGFAGFLAGSVAPAEALEVCARKNRVTGAPAAGGLKLKQRCTGNSVAIATLEQIAVLQTMDLVDYDKDGSKETLRIQNVDVQLLGGQEGEPFHGGHLVIGQSVFPGNGGGTTPLEDIYDEYGLCRSDAECGPGWICVGIGICVPEATDPEEPEDDEDEEEDEEDSEGEGEGPITPE